MPRRNLAFRRTGLAAVVATIWALSLAARGAEEPLAEQETHLAYIKVVAASFDTPERAKSFQWHLDELGFYPIHESMEWSEISRALYWLVEAEIPAYKRPLDVSSLKFKENIDLGISPPQESKDPLDIAIFLSKNLEILKKEGFSDLKCLTAQEWEREKLARQEAEKEREARRRAIWQRMNDGCKQTHGWIDREAQIKDLEELEALIHHSQTRTILQQFRQSLEAEKQEQIERQKLAKLIKLARDEEALGNWPQALERWEKVLNFPHRRAVTTVIVQEASNGILRAQAEIKRAKIIATCKLLLGPLAAIFVGVLEVARHRRKRACAANN
jgi:hypothetical protein